MIGDLPKKPRKKLNVMTLHEARRQFKREQRQLQETNFLGEWPLQPRIPNTRDDVMQTRGNCDDDFRIVGVTVSLVPFSEIQTSWGESSGGWDRMKAKWRKYL